MNADTVRRGTVLVALCLIPAAAGACSSSSGPEDEAFDVVGAWEWVRSVGGIAGETRTPASEGYGQRLEIDADGELRHYRDDDLAVETTWSAVSGPVGLPAQIDFGQPFPFGFPFAEAGITDGGSTLLLRDPCCDGFERTFTRTGS